MDQTGRYADILCQDFGDCVSLSVLSDGRTVSEYEYMTCTNYWTINEV